MLKLFRIPIRDVTEYCNRLSDRYRIESFSSLCGIDNFYDLLTYPKTLTPITVRLEILRIYEIYKELER